MPKIRVSAFGVPESGVYEPVVDSVHPWPENTFLQGGHSGVVLSKTGSYKTAFVEAFVANSFVRGEGVTLQDAEDNAWEKFQTISGCVSHEYEPRSYRNGAGVCKHCNKFARNVFTGKDLGQFCAVCYEPTVYGLTYSTETETEVWGCESHLDVLQELYYDFLNKLPEGELTPERVIRKRTLEYVFKTLDDAIPSKEQQTELLKQFFDDLVADES